MYEGLDGVFFLTLGTMVFGFLGLSVRYCLKSKCDDCSICFGMIKIHRNVKVELQEEKLELENHTVEEKI